ncbi:MAG TPA: gliding motility-associated C-terminal domain-containing protein, partial [Mucilaginibacter sp.]|nr:gliding motility-associated C-terminal domain-containing protein [Mucilaginibacter sp.]
CDQQMGYITPTIIGYTPVKDGQTYTWINVATGEVVGKGLTLSHVGAGTYRITLITQISGCRATATYTVNNISPPLPPPIAKGTTICTPGTINITVTNADTSKLFRLYDSPTSTMPIDSSKNGIFYRNVDQTTDFYVTRVSNLCESERTKVTEVVVASFKRPNAFTPNGDGINDFWNLEGVDKFPGADIRIFTRNGQQIYHSVNYAIPFDGTYNGHKLPAGVYYYIIDLKQPICYGKISGNLTIIR